MCWTSVPALRGTETLPREAVVEQHVGWTSVPALRGTETNIWSTWQSGTGWVGLRSLPFGALKPEGRRHGDARKFRWTSVPALRGTET